MDNLETSWDFVEKYFPNYYSSNRIGEQSDLQVLLDEGFLTPKEKEQVKTESNSMLVEIYETAITEYLKTIK